MQSPTLSNSALMLVDVQYDFLEGGALGVSGSKSILPTAYQLLDPSLRWKAVVASQDYHPGGHVSFATTHGREPFTQMVIEEKNIRLDLWPDHCVQGTRGSELELGIQERLDMLRGMGREVKVIKKGTEINFENYSTFKDDEDDELDRYLKTMGICNLFCLGLTGDYCVKATVESAIRKGYRVFWVRSGIASVGGSEVQDEIEKQFLMQNSNEDPAFVIAGVETVKNLDVVT